MRIQCHQHGNNLPGGAFSGELGLGQLADEKDGGGEDK